MSETYIKDEVHFVVTLKKFIAYVINQNKKDYAVMDGLISFKNPNDMLYHEENYKLRVAYTAQTNAHIDEWDKNLVRTGKIVVLMIKAITKCDNLVNRHQITFFIDKVKDNKEKSEEILYGIYKEPNECKAFSDAVDFFGRKYDLISFLYFMKVPTRFLPTRSTRFDSAFNKLHIDFKMENKCSWENYNTYLEIIKEIKEEMDKYSIPLRNNDDLRLIDAHSFVWIINEEKFADFWNKNQEEERIIERDAEIECQSQAKKTEIKHQDVIVRTRSREVIERTKQRAKGICQLCKKPAPFESSDGNPYLEVHHIEWLSRGGVDNINNTVALCPNCHAKMHIVDNPVDVKQLKDIVKN